MTTPPGHVTFYQELARRRRQARLLSVACLVIASGIGIVMSCLVTPLVLLAAGFLLHLAARLGIAPTAAHAAIHAIGAWALSCGRQLDILISSLDHIHGLRALQLLLPPLAALAPFCLPALTASALLWLLFRAISRRTEGGDLAARLQARPPRNTDAEEHQATNIAAEIAIAAGITPPRVLMLDAPGPNAAAIGANRNHATLFLSRGLLDTLSRDETSGVVAHLVASVAQGDMRLTHGVLAVFQTFGFYFTFLDLPFRWSAWRSLGGLALIIAGLRRDPRDITRTLDSVENSLNADAMPDVDRLWSGIPFDWLRKVLLVPMLPLLLISILLRMVLFLWSALFLGPPLAWIWHLRRYAADATAVEFTRDPDALARALTRIGFSPVPAGAEGREYCFIQASRAARESAARSPVTASLHPALAKRLQRLVALGAADRWATRRRTDWAALRAHPLAMLLIGFLLFLLIPLGIALVAAIGFLTLIAMTLSLAAGLTIVSAIFA